jgi:hypothetical protein
MKKLVLLIFLLPELCFSQEHVSNQIYGFNMPIELDNDTIYNFVLDNTKCTQSLFGVNEIGGCNYMDSYPFLYFSHQFSMNCCTVHYYQMKISGDSIYISHSETGDFCLCGSCTYELTFSDPNPQKPEYHIFMAGNDTTVSILSTFQENIKDKINAFYNPIEDRICIINKGNDNESILFSLFDLNGKLKIKKQISVNLNSIDAKILPSGIYIIQISNASYNKRERIIIQK